MPHAHQPYRGHDGYAEREPGKHVHRIVPFKQAVRKSTGNIMRILRRFAERAPQRADKCHKEDYEKEDKEQRVQHFPDIRQYAVLLIA